MTGEHKTVRIYEESKYAWRKCSICGGGFLSTHRYAEAFGFSVPDDESVCYPCAMCNEKGTTYKAVKEREAYIASLKITGKIKDGDDVFTLYE